MRRGTLAELADAFGAHPPRGEVVLVVGPASAADDDDEAASERTDDATAEVLARDLAAGGVWGRDLRRALEQAGVARDAAYALAVRFGRRSDPAE